MELEKNLPEPANAPQPEVPATARGAPQALEIPDDALILVPVRNLVLFPGMVLPVTIGRELSVAAAQAAVKTDRPIGLVLQKDPTVDRPGRGAPTPGGQLTASPATTAVARSVATSSSVSARRSDRNGRKSSSTARSAAGQRSSSASNTRVSIVGTSVATRIGRVASRRPLLYLRRFRGLHFHLRQLRQHGREWNSTLRERAVLDQPQHL